jgi:CRP/FNR family cyclic AMP-dependent transcriptional regulator
MMVDVPDVLSRVSLFSLMKKKDLKRIGKLSHHHSFKKDEVIIREGTRDGRLFIIISGHVEVIKDLHESGRQTLRTFGANSYFGEMALIDDYIRTASVVAVEDTEALTLDQWNIREEIKKYPSVAIELLQTLGRRIRAFEEKS